MSRVLKSVNPKALDGLVAWGSWAPGFEQHHAADGLFVAERYFEHETHASEVIYRVALLLAFWFWLDDRSDGSLNADRSLVEWESLFDATDVRATKDIANAGPEAAFVWRMREEIRPLAAANVDFEWWLTSVRYTAEGYRAEERLSRARRSPEYSEYVEIGYWSSTLVSIVGTFSLVQRAGLASRRADVWLMRLERCLALLARLQNDLHSIEKDLNEDCVANGVLVLRSVMPEPQAVAFVRRQIAGYEAIIAECFAVLGPEDPLARLGRAMLRTHEQWYAHQPERYAT